MVSQRIHDFFWLWGFFLLTAEMGICAFMMVIAIIWDLNFKLGFASTHPFQHILHPMAVLLWLVLPLTACEVFAMILVWDDERRGCYPFD